ncbi:MAG: hypothetical protein NTZ56_23340 [Acidobacteria bacterium]|nr:hypothetical protein [Acidobacteriota bacterium]
MVTTEPFEDFLLVRLRDPEVAAQYLKQVLTDGDDAEKERALRNIAQAQGVTPPAKEAA